MNCGPLDTPPPCPVDDTPYTACVAPSAALRRAQQLAAASGKALPPGTVLAVPVASPLQPRPAPLPATTIGPSVTTGTYRGRHPKPPRRMP